MADPMEIDENYTNLIFRDFPPVWNIITMPPGMIVYRASNNDPMIAIEPRFFSEYQVANEYRNKYKGNLYSCELTSGIKLCDIRTLRYLVLEIMFNLQIVDQSTANTLKDGMKSFMYAFGLFSYKDQVEFINNEYIRSRRSSPYNIDYKNRQNPFTNIGSRISYGVVDDKAVYFLKSLLGEVIDGYISPVLQTPWHDSRGFKPEICLFNPKQSIKTSTLVSTAPHITHNIDFKLILQSAGYKYVSNTVHNTGITGSTTGGKKPHQRGARGNKHLLRMSGGTQLQVTIRDRGEGKHGDEPSSPVPQSQQLPSIKFPIIARNHTFPSDWKVGTNDVLEKLIEQSFKIQCALSTNKTLKNFMGTLLIKMTNLLHETFTIVTKETNNEVLIQTIKYHYRPQEHIDGNTIYVLKPGITTGSVVVKSIIEKEETAQIAINQLTLAEMMGAQYGILTHAGMFTLMFQACIKYGKINTTNKQETYPNIAKLSDSYETVVEAIGNLFGVRQFNLETMSSILDNDDLVFKKTLEDLMKVKDMKSKDEDMVYDVKKGNMRNIIMDMMVNNPITAGNVSIVRKNLNNQEYIRTRVQKSVKDKPDYKVKRTQPECPKFYESASPSTPQTVMMVEGDEWYAVTANGFFRHLMDSKSRIWKAGPSGSTFMWMNMVFSLLGIPPTEDNYKLLLLCIIADFVPMYHSLPEVLLVYSMENPHTNENLYTLDQNPIQWLCAHMGVQPAPSQQRGAGFPPLVPINSVSYKPPIDLRITLDPAEHSYLERILIQDLDTVIERLTPTYTTNTIKTL
jgi:hypothetical protein